MAYEIHPLYEDNHLIICLKPAGVLSQADGSSDPDMLQLIKGWLKEKYQKPGNVFLGLVHRLDKQTSGLMVFAKTSKAASRLSEQFRGQRVEKKYGALVSPVSKLEKKGRLEHFGLSDKYLGLQSSPFVGAKQMRLEYEVIKTSGTVGYLEVRLFTGRKHQIRKQFAFLGAPVVGDTHYGSELNWPVEGIALFSISLGLHHPTTQSWLEFTWEEGRDRLLSYLEPQ